MITLTIEKLVNGGQGLARADGKTYFIWNALPGETVEAEVISNKKGYAEAIAKTILTPSPERVEPKEPQFLSTSPWDILDPECEAYWKKAIAIETYGKIGGLILQNEPPEIVSPENYYDYRNKMEFSFVEVDGKMSLAFFERGKKWKLPVTGSVLADPLINETAQHILAWINEQQIPSRSLKALILRSNNEGQVIAALFIKDKLQFDSYPTRSEQFLGFTLYYSTHKSPASVPTQLLYQEGQDYLVTDILGTKLKYGLLSFFQINTPIFTEALKDIAAFLDPHVPVVDFYSGVGAISLPLSLNRKETILVDNNEEAIQYARENIIKNNREHCRAECMPAEKITELIRSDAMIILDPPRAGLHEKMVRTLLQVKPPRIIYLSCDLSTQARDMRILSEGYKVTFLKLYNFFPRTPHIEGLCVLDRI